MFNFDNAPDRTSFDSIKWSYLGDRSPNWPGGVIPMWVADMDIASPPAVVEAVVTRAKHPVYGYAGKPESFFLSFIEWMKKRHSADIAREWLEFSPGIVPAIATAIRAYSERNDGIVIMPPVYHPFRALIEKNKRTVREAPLQLVDGRYRLDLPALEAASRGARMLILCSPHNPIGRVWNRMELEAITDIAEKNDLIVIADEIHADLVFSPNKHIASLNVGKKLSRRLVSCWAPSKTFNIAGLQTSLIAIPDPQLRRAFADETEAGGISGPNCMACAAAQAAYENGETWLNEALVYIKGNFDHLSRQLAARVPDITMYPSEGTFLAWLDFKPAGLSGDVYAAVLEKTGIWLDPGTRFGTGGEGFARMNLGCTRKTLDLAIDRLATAFGKKN